MRGRANGTVSAYAYCRLGDITADQFRGLADIQRDFDVEVRITNRQNFVLRGLTEDQLRDAPRRGSPRSTWPRPGAELARDVVVCPGADTCNLAVTQSRGLAADIGRALDDAGLAEVGGRAHQHLRLHELLRPAPHRRHRVLRARAPRARPRGARATRCCSAATSATWRSRSARRPRSSRRRRRAEAVVRSSAGSPTSATAGETFAVVARPAPAAPPASARRSRTSTSSPTPDEAPDFYVDFDETGPYVAESATASARHERPTDRLAPRDGRRASAARRRARPTSRELAAVVGASSRRKPATVGDRVGVGALRRRARARGVVPGLRAHRPRARRSRPSIEVVFLDTQYHFAETLWYVEQVRERYDLNLTRRASREVEPDDLLARRPRRLLRRCARSSRSRGARAARQAWMTGLRRDEAPTRATHADRRASTSAAAS